MPTVSQPASYESIPISSLYHTPLLPTTKVQLLLEGNSVSRNLPGAIRKHHGRRILYKYMLERFRWPEALTDSVDWDGFAAAYKTCFKQRDKFSVRFSYVHKWIHAGMTLSTVLETEHV